MPLLRGTQCGTEPTTSLHMPLLLFVKAIMSIPQDHAEARRGCIGVFSTRDLMSASAGFRLHQSFTWAKDSSKGAILRTRKPGVEVWAGMLACVWAALCKHEYTPEFA